MVELGISGRDARGVGAPSGWRRLAGTRGYDRLVRLAVALWFLFIAINTVRTIAQSGALIAASGADTLAVARLVSYISLFFFVTLIAGLTLLRARPLAQAAGLQPRLSALLGSYLVYGIPMLPPNTQLGAGLHILSAALLLTGNALAIFILLRLGRSFSIMAESRRLVTEGPYAVIRHPLYLAELIATLGAFIQFASPWAALIVLVQFGFQVQRMRNEESVLALTFPDYAAYKERTARLIPALW